MSRTYQIVLRNPALGGGWNLFLFEDGQPAGSGFFPVPQEDPATGMAWWNSISEEIRAHWLMMSASAVPADARHAFRLAEAYEDAHAQGNDWMGVYG